MLRKYKMEVSFYELARHSQSLAFLEQTGQAGVGAGHSASSQSTAGFPRMRSAKIYSKERAGRMETI